MHADEDDHKQRLDVVVARRAELPRGRARVAIDDGTVTINGKVITKPSHKVLLGDLLELVVPGLQELSLEPQDLPIEIVYEDDMVVVVNKPPGMVVHPAAGHPDGTLVNALLYHCKGSLAGIGGVQRPGIVHRIDRFTSGLLVVTKTDEVHQSLQAQFAARTIKREYRTLCAQTSGKGLDTTGTFDTFHGRMREDRKRFTGNRGTRRAVTHYKTLERFEHGATHVACTLETGRTHQIRVHLSEYGCPILGDDTYGGRAVAGTRLISRLALHARSLGFDLPDGRSLYFEAEPPDDFADALQRLRKGVSWRK